MTEDTATETVTETQVADTTADTPATATEKPAEGTEAAAPDPKPAKTEKPAWQNRIDRLTREKNEERTGRERAERELAVLKAAAPPKEGDKSADVTLSADEFDRRAEEKARTIVAQREFTERLNTCIREGRAEYDDFDDKSQVVASFGATDRREFMEALVSVPHAHRVVAHLADNPDEAMRLMDMTPIRMATELGRISVRVADDEAPPKRAQSRVPAPIKPVGSRASVEPRLDDPNLSTKDWIALRNKQVKDEIEARRRR